jgi:DNA-binding LytR/AlgR family response regulator
MPSAIIADDEPALRLALAGELGALWPELDIVHQARNGVEAAERIAALQPDFAFLDIRMPGLSGLEVAEGIEGATRVVFVTAYDEYAVRAFEQQALDYVLKPVSRERLAHTVRRLRDALADATGDGAALLAALRALRPPPPAPATEPLRWIRAGAGALMHQIAVHDIVYFHADDKYTGVRTALAEYVIRTPIAELVQQLDALQFQQVHRSTIVNLQHVAGTRRDDASRLFLRFKGLDQELPVSRAYVHLFKAM